MTKFLFLDGNSLELTSKVNNALSTEYSGWDIVSWTFYPFDGKWAYERDNHFGAFVVELFRDDDKPDTGFSKE